MLGCAGVLPPLHVFLRQHDGHATPGLLWQLLLLLHSFPRHQLLLLLLVLCWWWCGGALLRLASTSTPA
jgi:hypothetical protein